ncbi:hypothetical protein B0H10DRAFT_2235036 [Mycena sp. CBHHK59/15]|nr:hypothetical protein B0H10DRAFT_2235036 [Mycena sp. CBHHK59/15]
MLSTLQQPSTWTLLGRVALDKKMPYFAARYFEMGDKLSSNNAAWRATIHNDLSSWIQIYKHARAIGYDGGVAKYETVLCRVWQADEVEAEQFGGRKTLALTFTALSNFWKELDPSNEQKMDQFVHLTTCTASTALAHVSTKFKALLSDRLSNTLFLVAQRLNAAIVDGMPETTRDGLAAAARILDELGTEIRGERIQSVTQVALERIIQKFHQEIQAWGVHFKTGWPELE